MTNSSKLSEKFTLPEFLFVQKLNSMTNQKLIIETNKNLYFFVFDFNTFKDLEYWLDCNKDYIKNQYQILHKVDTYNLLIATLKPKEYISDEELKNMTKLAGKWCIKFIEKENKFKKSVEKLHDSVGGNLGAAKMFFGKCEKYMKNAEQKDIDFIKQGDALIDDTCNLIREFYKEFS